MNTDDQYSAQPDIVKQKLDEADEKENSNASLHALHRLQNQMRGRAEKSGFKSEEDVADWITESRRNEKTV